VKPTAAKLLSLLKDEAYIVIWGETTENGARLNKIASTLPKEKVIEALRRIADQTEASLGSKTFSE